MQTNTHARAQRRRRKTKTEVFKEAYLPYIIFAITLILVLTFIIGAVLRRNEPTESENTGAALTSTALCIHL